MNNKENNMKGKFIVFEALDAAGKSTQVDLLIDNLIKAGISVWKTKECTDNPIGKLIRSDYLSGKQKCDEHVINILMAADRLEHVASKDGILDHINKGDWVICDRFVLSTFAYDNYHNSNISDLNNGFDTTYNMNKYAMDKIVPDLTIFLNVPVDTCMARLLSRGNDKEIYEDRVKLEMIHKTYEEAKIYLKHQRDYNMHIVDIDGLKSIDDIAKEIYDIIKEHFL